MRNAAAVMMVMAEWWRWEGLNFDFPAARSPHPHQNRGVPHKDKPYIQSLFLFLLIIQHSNLRSLHFVWRRLASAARAMPPSCCAGSRS